jgi:glyoxylase-like metal-dependent hydrolase (beta-lactamase superfamily II)
MSAIRAAIVPVTPFQQNCSILWDEPSMQAVVVDPGGDVDRILEAIGKLGVRPDRIWLTHGHIDHAGGAAGLREALQQDGGTAIPIEGPAEQDRFLLQGLEQQGRMYGIGGVRNVLPDRWLKEGDELRLGEHAFEVFHCPGHTPGHVALVNRAARFAVVGDVLFRGSVGRTDFAYGDHEALIRSIRTKLFPLGDDITFLCGHGPGSTFGAERQENPFAGEGAA